MCSPENSGKVLAQCLWFERTPTPDGGESLRCIEKNTTAVDGRCGGWSDGCQFQDGFQPRNGIPKERVSFTLRPTEELIEAMQRSWNKSK